MSNEAEQARLHEMAVDLASHPSFQYIKKKILETHKTTTSVITMTDNQLSRMYAFEAGVLELFRYVEAAAEGEQDLSVFNSIKPFEHYGNEE